MHWLLYNCDTTAIRSTAARLPCDFPVTPTNTSARLVSVHSLSSTSLLSVLILTIDRNKHFVASSTEELFRTLDVRNVLDFIEEIQFYNKL